MTLLDRLADARVLAILRMDDVATAGVETAARLHDAGVRAIECTLDRSGAIDAISTLRGRYGTDTVVGAGTVTEVSQIDELADVGVDFCVTPHLHPELVEAALAGGVPMIPGVMTPSEVAAAFRLGATAVKLFPAGSLGVDYLKSLQGPFGRFAVIPTGGIDVGDVPTWLDAGATCVGMGSALTGPDGTPLDLAGLLRR